MGVMNKTWMNDEHYYSAFTALIGMLSDNHDESFHALEGVCDEDCKKKKKAGQSG